MKALLIFDNLQLQDVNIDRRPCADLVSCQGLDVYYIKIDVANATLHILENQLEDIVPLKLSSMIVCFT